MAQNIVSVDSRISALEIQQMEIEGVCMADEIVKDPGGEVVNVLFNVKVGGLRKQVIVKIFTVHLPYFQVMRPTWVKLAALEDSQLEDSQFTIRAIRLGMVCPLPANDTEWAPNLAL